MIELDDFRDGYVDLVKHVRDNGDRTAPRGYGTVEVRGATIRVHDTHKLLPYGIGRDPKPEIGYAEALLLVAGLQSPSLMTSVSPTFRRFMDGGALQGAYGPRVRRQLDHTIEQLRRDPDSRQAIVQVYDPWLDQVPVRDVSCTLGFGFHIRDDELHMHSTMRSQDVWLGAGYDLFMFGQLGHTVANALGVDLATITHHVYSLHLYDRNIEATEALHAYSGGVNYEPTGFGSRHRAGAEWEWYRARAEQVYNNEDPDGRTLSELDYLDLLRPYARETAVSNFSS